MQRGRRRGDGVEGGSGDGGMESAAAVETPVESRTTGGVAQRRRLPVASAHSQTVCRQLSPFFIAQRNGGPPTIKGWTPPIRARIKGLIGRWAY